MKLAFLIFDVKGTGCVPVDGLQPVLDNALAHRGAEASPSKKLLSLTKKKELNFEEFCDLLKREPGILDSALEVARARVGDVFGSFESAAAEAARLKAEKEQKAQTKKQK